MGGQKDVLILQDFMSFFPNKFIEICKFDKYNELHSFPAMVTQFF